ncbi:C-C motif chemokine 14-like [Sturnira hondurensis]|uniref:C-C motif chemokine 14-like n=1 Tax=Sturnira hondurensis TaxID=192404 RepID=UPI001879FC49|nr:C-C motif chemokine 14-like [Sturnira hondurensis]
MKVFPAALPFLILAAALGPQTHASLPHGSPGHAVHHTSDCCLSYSVENIQCEIMEEYYETSSECPLPAVIFITKRDHQVCADPHSRSVQHCMEDLDSAKKQRKRVG